jgi:hypothetical protein
VPVLQQPPGAPVVIEPRLSRRAQRAAERRRQRRQRRILAAITAGVVALAAIVLFVVRGHSSSPDKSVAAAGARTQSTLLLSLRAGDGSAAASVLLADDPAHHQGAEVLVPGRVIVDAPGYGSHPFAQVLTLPGAGSLSRAALTDLVGVTVDGYWTLDQTSFGRLVDTLGGIDVRVDRDVVRRTAGGGGQVLVPAGRQHLNGASAWAYATYVAAGEDPTAQLPRVQTVLDGVLAKMPRDEAAAGRIVGAFRGATDRSTKQLAHLFVGLATDARGSDLTYTQLPVLDVDTGGPLPTYRIDSAKVQQLVKTSFAGSQVADGDGAGRRVLVENAVGTPGLGASVRDRIVKAGYVFVSSSNFPPFGRAQSLVLVFQDTPGAQAKGAALAKALGLPVTSVRFSPRGQSVADIVVILGRDYRS